MFRLKLDELLYEKRLNPNKLAKMTGIRYATITDMVENKSKHWSLENLEKIMIALGLNDTSELIEYRKGQEE
ncbi:helix-turn-helix domain-containing protein [Paenibacillus polymyxa]|uniref:helix-turn-helix domain-containing protein n=1 Tax=Paenibacillus polymyxa TaxID=1406 RepID=UPI000F4D9D85|nr:helix-turn-helix transcriptional regulator [Paenibacillus polymyxa]RPE03294.1 XRE family transcriptional regulator [Paenibacillus polymyxa]